jgi:hypothetical protein
MFLCSSCVLDLEACALRENNPLILWHKFIVLISTCMCVRLLEYSGYSCMSHLDQSDIRDSFLLAICLVV